MNCEFDLFIQFAYESGFAEIAEIVNNGLNQRFSPLLLICSAE